MITQSYTGHDNGEVVHCMQMTLGRISHICFIWYIMCISTTSAFTDATVDTAIVYTTGALLSVMAWEQY